MASGYTCHGVVCRRSKAVCIGLILYCFCNMLWSGFQKEVLSREIVHKATSSDTMLSNPLSNRSDTYRQEGNYLKSIEMSSSDGCGVDVIGFFK